MYVFDSPGFQEDTSITDNLPWDTYLGTLILNVLQHKKIPQIVFQWYVSTQGDWPVTTYLWL